MKVGLRIDVDTFSGTKYGVPTLCRLLAKHSIFATFFFSVGPDNMGRHLWRLIHPSFFWKMLRTRASTLYGWDILLRGLLWPGPIIGEELGDIIRFTSESGHEVGLHAWDHHAWQAHVDTMESSTIRLTLKKGVELLTRIIGQPPRCSAVPAWKCNHRVLLEKAKFSFQYNSDCRGESIFRPLVEGLELSQPQIPVTLPTYDEVIGRNGISNNNYNDRILSLLRPDRLNVFTIHAEVEGRVCSSLFDQFLEMARIRGVLFTSLGSLLVDQSSIDRAAMEERGIPGREGYVSCQSLPVEKERLEAQGGGGVQKQGTSTCND